MPENNNGPLLQPSFLRKKIHFILTLAVIATVLLSWYNFNSYCIFLLVFCRLIDGSPLRAVKNAFTNKYFLAFLGVFLIEAASLLHTHNYPIAWRNIEEKGTLVAIPFVLCAGPFTDAAGRKRLLSAFTVLLFAICTFCLIRAFFNYGETKSPAVFFYHALSGAVKLNAVFFSGYVFCSMLFLLSTGLDLGITLSRVTLKILRFALLLFFMGMMVLLSSKLLLVLLAIAGASFMLKKPARGASSWLVICLGSVAIVLAGLIMFTDNPVKSRYEDIMHGDPALYKQNKLSPETAFNGVSLRLLIWRNAGKILKEQKAWLFGVSAGDSQDLLNQKYLDAGMYTGVPGTHNRGFLGYNFHNQYIEILVQSGIVGLLVYLIGSGLMVELAIKKNTSEAWFTVLLVLLLCMTESMLEMQQSEFFSVFFPLLLIYSPARRKGGAVTQGQ
jgi:O-antigen ligase